MGITPLTLVLASARDEEIPDHGNNNEMVKVKVLKDRPGKHPLFVLVYKDGTVREVVWRDGQGYAGKVLVGPLEFVENKYKSDLDTHPSRDAVH